MNISPYQMQSILRAKWFMHRQDQSKVNQTRKFTHGWHRLWFLFEVDK